MKMVKQLGSVEALVNLERQAKARLAKLEEQAQVKVHLGTCGISSGANKVLDAFTREVESRRLSGVTLMRIRFTELLKSTW